MYGNTNNITQKLAFRRKRAMTGAFHIGNSSGKTGPNQLTFLNMGRHQVCGSETHQFRLYVCQQDYYRKISEMCLREILSYHFEYAMIHKVENGHFDIKCVAQYAQNTRERLQFNKGNT
jgi:hypothetical protein